MYPEVFSKNIKKKLQFYANFISNINISFRVVTFNKTLFKHHPNPMIITKKNPNPMN